MRRKKTAYAFVSVVTLSALGAGPARAAAGLKAAVFDVEPFDLPLTPKMKDRLKAETVLLRQEIAARGLTAVDTAPQAAKIAANLPLSQCNGCDQDIAKALGADVIVATAVQPASAATFNLSGSVKDVATNRVLRQGVVNVQGEGDDQWTHGVKFLVQERLCDPPLPGDAEGLKKAVAALPKAP